ncbi:xanthine dehydrogenase accessory protein XdhC [Thalassotalea profundi]|uniref:Xanthine dehydrogenase accessory protein XdhC n=1 Tax=Thalassotalea profundi TaxID=2036687 RepID=A0ABQ3IGJ4_9GAMM|nr:xanthine dehydrogenase accessory protein XdhC [Thalassotalea profundi]GHE82927.1 hypothetical protein GCM10011501_09080 [Thalassotalea profundi]
MNSFDNNRFDQEPTASGNSFNNNPAHKLNWNQASLELAQKGKAYVLITIIGVSGSTPRNSGTKMVVTLNNTAEIISYDTIGGGHLEYKAIKHAQTLLMANKDCQTIEHFQLGSQLGQCCGGNASLLFECFATNAIHIAVFGAGHVGQALMPMLAGLPCRVTWLDNRESQFSHHIQGSIYANVTQLITDDPASEVASMPINTIYVVMTHNHQLDFDISLEILKREDFHYLGLIASDTKWRRFQQRYKHREISPSLVERMNCPIGLEQVVGKMPMEVAVSVAGKIIESYQALLPNINLSRNQKNKGVSFKEIKQLLSSQQVENQSTLNEQSITNLNATINLMPYAKNEDEDYSIMNNERDSQNNRATEIGTTK